VYNKPQTNHEKRKTTKEKTLFVIARSESEEAISKYEIALLFLTKNRKYYSKS